MFKSLGELLVRCTALLLSKSSGEVVIRCSTSDV